MSTRQLVNSSTSSTMTTDRLKEIILTYFQHEPTTEQNGAIDTFCQFMTTRVAMLAMVMRGSAGTGKTTLAGAIVRTLSHLRLKTVLLAPTGRAAKVFALNSGHQALTIHRKIYRQKAFGMDTGFSLGENLHQDTLFIIDEASMIANGGSQTVFGEGMLLDDLVSYVYSGRNCRMMLIGDRAQLPPVGELSSPALDASFLAGYGLEVMECDLNEVLRQSQDSGILYNATVIRQMMERGKTQMPTIRLKGFADICVVMGDELIDAMSTSYRDAGIEETIVVTRSNKRANIYNQGIRNTILDREELLTRGDMLMIVKNNYYWANPPGRQNANTKTASNTGKEEAKDGLSFLANGDRAIVERVRNERDLYGFHFADVRLRMPDYDNTELTVTIVTDSLLTDAPALTQDQNHQLYEQVMEDYIDIPLKSERLKKVKEDIYFNALQVKFSYAVTCHKAQGGQWAHVYLDQGYVTDDMIDDDYYHWLYTAFTRATEKLFLVNWKTDK